MSEAKTGNPTEPIVGTNATTRSIPWSIGLALFLLVGIIAVMGLRQHRNSSMTMRILLSGMPTSGRMDRALSGMRVNGLKVIPAFYIWPLFTHFNHSNSLPKL